MPSTVENAPTGRNSGAEVIERISHFRQTFFETPFEVINIPNPNNSAYTALGLRNHLDLPYYEIPPGYQFLHCLVNDATGGDSTAIDGFKVASYMKDNFPEFFKILTEVPVKFVNRDYTQNTTTSVRYHVARKYRKFSRKKKSERERARARERCK